MFSKEEYIPQNRESKLTLIPVTASLPFPLHEGSYKVIAWGGVILEGRVCADVSTSEVKRVYLRLGASARC